MLYSLMSLIKVYTCQYQNTVKNITNKLTLIEVNLLTPSLSVRRGFSLIAC